MLVSYMIVTNYTWETCKHKAWVTHDESHVHAGSITDYSLTALVISNLLLTVLFCSHTI